MHTTSKYLKPATFTKVSIDIQELSLYYNQTQALKSVSLSIPDKHITALIGPSGCGKSSLLRCLNRLNELIEGTRIEGKVMLGTQNIYAPTTDVVALRKKVGMVFQRPNPFPKSIFENVAYGLKVNGERNKQKIQETVEKSLTSAGLWEEVKDRLHSSAMSLSGGQQQRLCIARTIAVEPDVILMDEPCSALDPIATQRIEDLIRKLKDNFTIVMVTHNMQQADRISDFTAFMYMGELIEFAPTPNLFNKPQKDLTDRYITGRFG